MILDVFLFVIVRNVINYVVIPLAQLYGTKWIEKHSDDNKEQLLFSGTSQRCE